MNGKVTYRQQFTRCGKERCRKCKEGMGHGPYWYAYWSENGRTLSKYIGSQPPEHLQNEQTQPTAPSVPAKAERSLLIKLYLLGQFKIEHFINGTWKSLDSRTWHRRRARSLLGCLLSTPGRRLGREQVMELLWPDLDIEVAANRLNGAVHELRQILEPDLARPATSRLLRLERDILELANDAQIWVDTDAFELLLKQAANCNDPAQSEQLLDQAAALYQGNYLLEELYSEWSSSKRDSLQRSWVGLLLNLADLRAARSAFPSAIEVLDRLRATDPFNETALQRLMIFLTHLDRRGEALQMYRQHEQLLQREYDGEPLSETTQLYEALRRGHLPPAPIHKQSKIEVHEEKKQPEIPVAQFKRPPFQIIRPYPRPIIGRDPELDQMRKLLRTLEQHQSATPPKRGSTSLLAKKAQKPAHFLLLKGEPGIGKTRLAEEISNEAYQKGWAIAWSRSYEQEGAIPYHPWTELLRTLLREFAYATQLQELVTRQSQQEQRVLPFRLELLGVLLPELAQSSVPGLSFPTVLHEQERLHLWETTLTLLSTLSLSYPLLIVMDDLHWTDECSIELLTYITHHLQDQKIIFIATCRDAEIAPQHRLHTLISDLQREQTIKSMAVKPLSSQHIEELLSHLTIDEVKRIQHQAAGNPFFAEELARTPETLTNRQPVQPEANPTLPEGISAVLERRLGKLSQDCQTLLSKAAVLGGSFALSHLFLMADLDENTVLDLLEEALYAGLLTESGSGTDISYQFWHPLIISHLYNRLSAARRAQLHRKAAETLKRATTTTMHEHASTIVYHLSRSGGSLTDLAYYAERAGNKAYALADYAKAQTYYLMVVQTLVDKQLPADEEEPTKIIHRINARALVQANLDNPRQMYQLLERISELNQLMGKFVEARYLCECILDLRTHPRFQHYLISPIEPDVSYQREAQVQALVWREIAYTWSSTGEYSRADQCLQHGKEVMARAGITSGPAWAWLHLNQGELHRLDGNYAAARNELEEGLAMLEEVLEDTLPQHDETISMPLDTSSFKDLSYAQRLMTSPYRLSNGEQAFMSSPLNVAYAHDRLGVLLASIGEVDQAIKHMTLALNIYSKDDLIANTARVSCNLGAIYYLQGENSLSLQCFHRSLDLAERAGSLPNTACVLINIGDVKYRSGQLDEAEVWYKRGFALAEQTEDRERICNYYVNMASIYIDRGNLPEAGAAILEALKTARKMQNSRCIRLANVRLGEYRLAQALQAQLDFADPTSALRASKQYLRKARTTLTYACAFHDTEIDHITEGKLWLAFAHLALGEIETALSLTLSTLEEAQILRYARVIGRAHRLLACIAILQGEYEKGQRTFERACHIFKEHDYPIDYARTLEYYSFLLLHMHQKYPEKGAMHDQQAIKLLHQAKEIHEGAQVHFEKRVTEKILSTFATVHLK